MANRRRPRSGLTWSLVIRTYPLIVLGTYVFVTISNFTANELVDSSGIIGQVVTEIGIPADGVVMAW